MPINTNYITTSQNLFRHWPGKCQTGFAKKARKNAMLVLQTASYPTRLSRLRAIEQQIHTVVTVTQIPHGCGTKNWQSRSSPCHPSFLSSPVAAIAVTVPVPTLVAMISSPVPPSFPVAVPAPAPAPAPLPSMITSVVVVPTTVPAPLPAFSFTGTYRRELTTGCVQT